MTEQLSIHFAGDSGDGMQLLGQQFVYNAIDHGWTVRTLPDFPAEIRAPHGTMAGVSGYMASLSNEESHMVADKVDVLVALNPAALMGSLSKLKPGGLVVINKASFKSKDLKKAGLDVSPLENGQLKDYQVFDIDITSHILELLADSTLSHSDIKKTKNFFVLGLVIWLFQLKADGAIQYIEQKFAKKKAFLSANIEALKGGYNVASNLELPHIATVTSKNNKKAHQKAINGAKAFALALFTLSVKTNTELLLSGYPITPASNIMHEFAKVSASNLMLFQAEDEIAAICASIGAAYAGRLACTCTSGPGMDLKSEGLGLAVMAELPLVVIDVQRAGPSTGLPTKVEQSDLLQAIYGRHGEAPLPVFAPKSPADCFYMLVEAFKIAIEFMTPVIILSDAFLANAEEQWSLPNFDELQLPVIDFNQYEQPFSRNAQDARSWNIPGSSGLQHTLGGLEKADERGGVTYDPDEHQKMVKIRAKKISNVALATPYELIGDKESDLLIVGWGSTYGSLREALRTLSVEGYRVALLHLRQLFPIDDAVVMLLKQYKNVVVFELNEGQLWHQLRALSLKDIALYSQTNGQPFKIEALVNRIKEAL